MELSRRVGRPLQSVWQVRHCSAVAWHGLGGHFSDCLRMEDGHTFEVLLERDVSEPSWGLLWDRKSFDRSARVIEVSHLVVPKCVSDMDRL